MVETRLTMAISKSLVTQSTLVDATLELLSQLFAILSKGHTALESKVLRKDGSPGTD